MARARNIKPGFFLNDDLCSLQPLARLLFAGLWCVADRAGRLEDKPRKIKIQVLPYDDCDIDLLLNDLATAGFILRYSVEDTPYIQIINFEKHQNPHKNEAVSIIPAPVELAQYKQDANPIQEPEEHNSNRADSLNPITDSLNPITYTAAQEVFDYWNLQNIIVHRDMTPEMEKVINKAIKETSLESVKAAICRFEMMLHDPEYELCSYTWDLITFLRRKQGYKHFLDDGPKWISYGDFEQKRYIKNQNRASPKKIPPEQQYEIYVPPKDFS